MSSRGLLSLSALTAAVSLACTPAAPATSPAEKVPVAAIATAQAESAMDVIRRDPKESAAMVKRLVDADKACGLKPVDFSEPEKPPQKNKKKPPLTNLYEQDPTAQVPKADLCRYRVFVYDMVYRTIGANASVQKKTDEVRLIADEFDKAINGQIPPITWGHLRIQMAKAENIMIEAGLGPKDTSLEDGN